MALMKTISIFIYTKSKKECLCIVKGSVGYFNVLTKRK